MLQMIVLIMTMTAWPLMTHEIMKMMMMIMMIMVMIMIYDVNDEKEDGDYA